MKYCNDPKFSDSQALSNSADPEEQSDQGYTVCHSVRIFWMHYFMVEQPRSDFRVINYYSKFSGIQIFRILTVVGS